MFSILFTNLVSVYFHSDILKTDYALLIRVLALIQHCQTNMLAITAQTFYQHIYKSKEAEIFHFLIKPRTLSMLGKHPPSELNVQLKTILSLILYFQSITSLYNQYLKIKTFYIFFCTKYPKFLVYFLLIALLTYTGHISSLLESHVSGACCSDNAREYRATI